MGTCCEANKDKQPEMKIEFPVEELNTPKLELIDENHNKAYIIKDDMKSRNSIKSFDSFYETKAISKHNQ
jgi:hypothetical protein